jgi:predicted kinase
VVRVDEVETKLIVIRGNSGAGKSTIAQELQRRHGRGCALVEQDHMRRIVLRERDTAGGLAPAFMEHVVRFTLDRGYHTVLEGILHSDRYGDMIRSLYRNYGGRTHAFYLEASWEETVRRHATRPHAQFTVDDMRAWFVPHDTLGLADEHIITESATIESAVTQIAATADLPLIGGDPPR